MEQEDNHMNEDELEERMKRWAEEDSEMLQDLSAPVVELPLLNKGKFVFDFVSKSWFYVPN